MNVNSSTSAPAAAPPPPQPAASKTEPTAQNPPGPAPAPAPPDPAKKADELVHGAQGQECAVSLPVVGDHFCSTETDGKKIGQEVGTLAKAEPAYARAVFEKALDKVPSAEDRKEIAHGLTDGLTHDELKQMAGTTQGRAMLDRAATELKAGSPSDADRNQATRIDSAVKAADLSKDPALEKLDPAAQAQVQDQIKRHEGDAAAVDNVVALAKSPGFQSATPAARQELLTALDHHAGDAIFREGLEKLAADPAFSKLSATQKADAISAFDGFAANNEAYKGKEGSWFFNLGATTVSDADKRQVLGNLTQVVTSQGFHDIAPDARKQLLDTFGAHATDAGFTNRLTRLVNDPGFINLNDQNKEIDLLKAYGSDNRFAAGLDNAMTTNPAYAALNGSQRAQVLTDLTKLTKTDSYQDAPDARKQDMVEIVADVADFSAANPGNKITRNTLDQVVDGKIKLQLYDKAPAGGFQEYGYSDGKDIFLNVNPAVRNPAFASDKYIDTLAHEANHHLNGDTKHDTPDRFIDEYRAFVVGREAQLGRTLTPGEQRAILDNLVGPNAAYANLRNQYLNDASFKNVVDGMYTTLNGTTDPKTGLVTTPPATVSPEDARTRLINGGVSGDYLKKPGNVDNH